VCANSLVTNLNVYSCLTECAQIPFAEFLQDIIQSDPSIAWNTPRLVQWKVPNKDKRVTLNAKYTIYFSGELRQRKLVFVICSASDVNDQ
jgi:hypothetical protein